jgi:hypothetical protein
VEADRPTAEAILGRDRPEGVVVSTLGSLKLYELAALLADAEIYVGPDAGPMHMAAAAGAPVIELGWVPPDYPVTSRGNGTGGRCWSPWTRRAITVSPPSAEFARAASSPNFSRQPIQGLTGEDVDRALASMLGPS